MSHCPTCGNDTSATMAELEQLRRALRDLRKSVLFDLLSPLTMNEMKDIIGTGINVPTYERLRRALAGEVE